MTDESIALAIKTAIEAERARIKTAGEAAENCALILPNANDIDDSKFTIDYDELGKNISKVQKANMAGVKELVEDQFNKQRIKSHEMAEILTQAILAAMNSSQQMVSEMSKLDPKTNPFFKYDAKMKMYEMALAESKIKESCEKEKLIQAQIEGYKVQSRVDVTKVFTSAWSTAKAQEKTTTRPDSIGDPSITSIMQELAEYVSDDNSEANKKFNPAIGKRVDPTNLSQTGEQAKSPTGE